MLTLFFTPGPVFDFDSALQADRERFACFFRAMHDGRLETVAEVLIDPATLY